MPRHDGRAAAVCSLPSFCRPAGLVVPFDHPNRTHFEKRRQVSEPGIRQEEQTIMNLKLPRFTMVKGMTWQ